MKLTVKDREISIDNNGKPIEYMFTGNNDTILISHDGVDIETLFNVSVDDGTGDEFGESYDPVIVIVDNSSIFIRMGGTYQIGTVAGENSNTLKFQFENKIEFTSSKSKAIDGIIAGFNNRTPQISPEIKSSHVDENPIDDVIDEEDVETGIIDDVVQDGIDAENDSDDDSYLGEAIYTKGKPWTKKGEYGYIYMIYGMQEIGESVSAQQLFEWMDRHSAFNSKAYDKVAVVAANFSSYEGIFFKRASLYRGRWELMDDALEIALVPPHVKVRRPSRKTYQSPLAVYKQ